MERKEKATKRRAFRRPRTRNRVSPPPPPPPSPLSRSPLPAAISRDSIRNFRRAGGIIIIIIIRDTLIKTRTTRPALRFASGAAPGIRRPRPRHRRRRRRLLARRRRSRRRSDYPAHHLGTSERIRRRCQLRFKSRKRDARDAMRCNAMRPQRVSPAAGSPAKVGETIRRWRFININIRSLAR